MAFLNFMKKKEDLPDIDLDMPPEPPKMMEKEISTKEPIDEELMLPKKKPKKEELPELPPLPKEEELPEIPPLPEIEELEPLPELPEETPKELEGLELPPPPEIKKEKGLFSFLKPKKAAEKLPLPSIGEELPAMPPLAEEEKFPEIPPMPEMEKISAPSLPEKEIPAPQPIELLKEEKPLPKEIKPVEKPIKKFITINDFRQIRSHINNTKGILKDMHGFFSDLEEVKNIGDKEYLGLYNKLQDIQKKLTFVDKTLFKEV